MPKVYFRKADSKAISKEIVQQVNYEQTLEMIKGRFGIEKNKITLYYNEQKRTGNFILNPQIPHHIVHIIDNSSVDDQEINICLTISNGKGFKKVDNLMTNAKITAKDLINKLYETEKINKEISPVEGTQLYLNGVKISDDEKFLDLGIENNTNINVQLRNNFPDPADVTTCSQLLANTVNPLVMGLQMEPKYQLLFSKIQDLKTAGFFSHLQQRYQGQRVSVIYSPYQAYRFPTSPQNQPQEQQEHCSQKSSN